MKKYFFPLLAVLFLACNGPEQEPITLIFDTDMGNDIDDAIALAIMNNYIDGGKTRVIGIGLSKEGSAPAAYVDIVQTWYGHAGIPIGVVRNSVGPVKDCYAENVWCQKDKEGNPLFSHSLSDDDYSKLPDAHILYRKLLADEPDNSVTFVMVGFSTNLARLLETGPDEYSSLEGQKLVAQKVKRLVCMAGNFRKETSEYNVHCDIPAARKVLEEWPTEIVVSPYEVGSATPFPAQNVVRFGGGKPNPVAEGYKAYRKMPYDRSGWDPSAMICGVEGNKFFTLSPPGHICVDSVGVTIFTPDPDNGKAYYLIVNNAQATALSDHMVELATYK
ncbi:MAG: nucleoside hydrolase [Bacteroidaceae bacterium]|nr:nucleoside hydrolase [Bacteroidaceae bacterium]